MDQSKFVGLYLPLSLSIYLSLYRTIYLSICPSIYVTENEKTCLVGLKFKIEFLLSADSPCFKLLPDGFDFAIWCSVAELHSLKALTAIKIKMLEKPFIKFFTFSRKLSVYASMWERNKLLEVCKCLFFTINSQFCHSFGMVNFTLSFVLQSKAHINGGNLINGE